MYLICGRFFQLGEDSDITDEQGRPVLHVDGKVLSLRNRLVLRDPEGREVAQVQRKLVAMRHHLPDPGRRPGGRRGPQALLHPVRGPVHHRRPRAG